MMPYSDRAAANQPAAAAKAAVYSQGIMSKLLGRRGLQVCALPRTPPACALSALGFSPCCASRTST